MKKVFVCKLLTIIFLFTATLCNIIYAVMTNSPLGIDLFFVVALIILAIFLLVVNPQKRGLFLIPFIILAYYFGTVIIESSLFSISAPNAASTVVIIADILAFAGLFATVVLLLLMFFKKAKNLIPIISVGSSAGGLSLLSFIIFSIDTSFELWFLVYVLALMFVAAALVLYGCYHHFLNREIPELSFFALSRNKENVEISKYELEKIQELGKLKEAGYISENEFAALKKEIIGRYLKK